MGRKGFVVDKVEDVTPAGLVSHVLEGLYHEAALGVPKEVLVPVEPDDQALYETWLTGQRGSRVTVRVEVSVWLPPDTDVVRALGALRAGGGVDVEVADVEKDAIRLMAATWADRPSDRLAIAAGLRASCLERLRSEGLSSGAGA